MLRLGNILKALIGLLGESEVNICSSWRYAKDLLTSLSLRQASHDKTLKHCISLSSRTLSAWR